MSIITQRAKILSSQKVAGKLIDVYLKTPTKSTSLQFNLANEIEAVRLKKLCDYTADSTGDSLSGKFISLVLIGSYLWAVGNRFDSKFFLLNGTNTDDLTKGELEKISSSLNRHLVET